MENRKEPHELSPGTLGGIISKKDAEELIECCRCGHKHKKGERVKKKASEFMGTYVCPKCGCESYYKS